MKLTSGHRLDENSCNNFFGPYVFSVLKLSNKILSFALISPCRRFNPVIDDVTLRHT